MDISYIIKFYSNWHCGSGLAAGADVDALVVKDRNGLPYVPGKTIKGLVREALQDIYDLQGKNTSVLTTMLGYETDNSEDSDNPEQTHNCSIEMQQGVSFFTNAELCKSEADAIIAANASKFLYNPVASTAVDPVTGIAKSHSLRRMQATVPCELHGSIYDVPKDLIEDTKNALRYIKRIGQSRNRGYGRCDIIIKKGGDA